ncbi:hypothetical protein BJ508DRAFT_372196 [Ascobolus immersus RN42]|uniref:Uncharacterized protein n=1 Tax=Ascobolus immersus RN42 TaxID=1160509 RepID=A0A3N4IN18_ASCIM|nr:hypothetical protein BJ508DRAFT_372196 [Ascobolus immersus RN42]
MASKPGPFRSPVEFRLIGQGQPGILQSKKDPRRYWIPVELCEALWNSAPDINQKGYGVVEERRWAAAFCEATSPEYPANTDSWFLIHHFVFLICLRQVYAGCGQHFNSRLESFEKILRPLMMSHSDPQVASKMLPVGDRVIPPLRRIYLKVVYFYWNTFGSNPRLTEKERSELFAWGVESIFRSMIEALVEKEEANTIRKRYRARLLRAGQVRLVEIILEKTMEALRDSMNLWIHWNEKLRIEKLSKLQQENYDLHSRALFARIQLECQDTISLLDTFIMSPRMRSESIETRLLKYLEEPGLDVNAAVHFMNQAMFGERMWNGLLFMEEFSKSALDHPPKYQFRSEDRIEDLFYRFGPEDHLEQEKRSYKIPSRHRWL